VQTSSVDAVSAVSGALNRDQQVQTALKNAGLYAGNIDGKIGPATRRAIQEFQRQNNLKVDGKVGPKTWAAMEHYISGAPETATQPSVDQ
jgi:peptidoglycan hydrolase-like protein with peptidoglycan-binding domain